MSMNLAELGHILCQEFDQRKLELNTLHEEIRTKVINDREEIDKRLSDDQANQQIARKQIMEDTSGLLDKYKAERKIMVKGLKADRISQIDEMKAWSNERGEELRRWYEAGGYMSRKSKESKGKYKVESHLLRKRTGR